MNEYGPWERAEGLDDFLSSHGLVGQPRGCTFCGSMSPDDFLMLVKAGAQVGPTDKSYKLYIEWLNPEPDKLHPYTCVRKGQEKWGNFTYYTWDEIPPELLSEAEEMYGRWR